MGVMCKEQYLRCSQREDMAAGVLHYTGRKEMQQVSRALGSSGVWRIGLATYPNHGTTSTRIYRGRECYRITVGEVRNCRRALWGYSRLKGKEGGNSEGRITA